VVAGKARKAGQEKMQVPEESNRFWESDENEVGARRREQTVDLIWDFSGS